MFYLYNRFQDLALLYQFYSARGHHYLPVCAPARSTRCSRQREGTTSPVITYFAIPSILSTPFCFLFLIFFIQYIAIEFWINGGATGGQNLAILATSEGNSANYRHINDLTGYPSLPANKWVKVRKTKSNLH